MRDLSGWDAPVRRWFEEKPRTKALTEEYLGLLENLIPEYAAEMKTHLLLAFGCTGGRHRSVFMAETMYFRFRELFPELRVSIHHRDRDQWR